MAPIIDNQEIHRTFISFEEIQSQRFYEVQNTRTTSSSDLYNSEMIYLNFIKKSERGSILNLKDISINENLSNQTELEKIELPIYFNENKYKINNLYKELKAKKHISEVVDNCFNLISNSISELNFYDIHLEITKANLIKITTLYDDNKILIMSKEVSETGADIIYSYFINKQLIASDVAEIKEFTEKFKEYLSL
jgi:hypothetical protein